VQRFLHALVRASLVVATQLIALTAFAHTAHAQGDLTFGPYLGYDRLVLNKPASLGLDLTAFMGPLGLRGSAALPWDRVRGRDPFTSSSYDSQRDWNADADLLLRLMSPGAARAPFLYGFFGVGAQGQNYQSTTSNNVLTEVRSNWSYGGGLSVPLGALTLTGEARYRRPYSSSEGFSTDIAPSREYRLGVGIHFGSGGKDRRYDSRPSRTTRRTSSAERARASGTIADVITTTSSSSSARARVIPTAEHYLGVKYVYGGTSPMTGFDCSGFVQYVFARHGVSLPRTSRQQAQVGTRLTTNWRSLTPGDLALFAEDGERVSHVAIYAGDNKIIHATSSGGSVRYDDLNTRRGQWFADHLVAARRVTPDASGLMLDLARGFSVNVELDRGDLAPRP
jgi:cell wall-associated NlpC family hydrolase